MAKSTKQKSKKLTNNDSVKQSAEAIKWVEKKDGRKEEFSLEKIANGIYKAAEVVGGSDRERAMEVAEEIQKALQKKYPKKDTVTVDQILSVLNQTLIDMGHAKTAKSFALYRDLQKNVRNIKSLIDADELVKSYIELQDWRVNENSNMSYSWQGLNNHISTSVQSNYWLYSIYPKHIAEAHINADLHIHDLGMLANYCCGWSLEEILTRGFTGVPGKISCAPAKHFSTALGQIVNFLYTLQHEAAGAQALSSFDTYLAPFVRYDNLNYDEVKQRIQEFVFNMNVPTRVGCQTPFTNITMDITPSGALAEESVIIGGERMPEQYKDFTEEIMMINRAFAEVMMEGDANGRVFTFPIPTYNITQDFDWNNPELEAVWEMTGKFGIPYFSNFINSDMNPDDARSMCCRLRLDNRELSKRGGGLFGSNPLTGSIGVVTLNLPRIGYLAKDQEDFLARIDKMMDIAKESLVIKRGVLEEFMERGLYPYSRFYLSAIKMRFGEYLKNHFNTIGVNGMNEALLNYFKDGTDLTTEKGQEFALMVMEHMRDRIGDYQEDTGDIFNLEATPAESTSYRLAKADLKLYPDIITADRPYGSPVQDDQSSNVSESYFESKLLQATDEAISKAEKVEVPKGSKRKKKVRNTPVYEDVSSDPYYTNSTQLPVGFTEDLFEAMDLQDDLQCKYTGGTVFHAFLGEQMPSTESVREMVKRVAYRYHMPYFSITPTFSICPKHGYIAGEFQYCPRCDEEIGYKTRPSRKKRKDLEKAG